MSAPPVLDADCIGIIGLGLIGGSIARGLRAAGFPGRVLGCVADAADAARARHLGLVDEALTDAAELARAADLVVVAVPVGAMDRVFAAIAPALDAASVVTDVGSTKVSVIRAARARLGPYFACFVPGHPISGTEKSGLEAGFAGLFQDRRVILTPLAETHAPAQRRCEQLWAALGARVDTMAPAHHDEVLAATSHLPHVLAFTLVDTLARMAERTEIFDYAAGGFADFTRIASSEPALWSDIVDANRAAILPVLDRFTDDLCQVRAAIAAGDQTTLTAVFARAKSARDGIEQQWSAS